METANPSANHKSIVTGIVIATLMGALSISFPILGLLCFLAMPLPIVICRLRLGRQPAVMVAGGAWVCLLFIGGGLSLDVWLVAGMFLLGFLMGEGLNRNLAVEKALAWACGIVFLSGGFSLMLYGNIANQGVSALVSGYIDQNLALSIDLYKGMGMPEDNIRVISEAMTVIRQVLIRILPSLLAAGLLLVAWLNLLLTKLFLKKTKSPYPVIRRLNVWKAPENLVWGVIATALMLVLPVGGLKILGLNGMIIFLVIYFFQGIAVVSFYFETRRVPPAVKVLLYSMIMIQQMFVLVVAGLGFMDIWLNFRRLGADNHKQDPLAS